MMTCNQCPFDGKYGHLPTCTEYNLSDPYYDRPSPPAEPKCERCEGDGRQRDSLGRIGDCECSTCAGSGCRPPTTEPAQSEENIMKTGTELITEERQRQIEVEGWTPEHDDEHDSAEMVDAAMCYAATAANDVSEYTSRDAVNPSPYAWPWDEKWWKPSDSRVRNLVKAGALIAAEIDRIQRQGDQR